jgi:anti-anti-sigma factor
MTSLATRPPMPVAAGDEVVVVLDEALLARGLADVRWLLHDAVAGGARRVVVDLGAIGSLSGPALATLLRAHRACRARGGGVVLRGAGERTQEALHRTGLWRVLALEGAGWTPGVSISASRPVGVLDGTVPGDTAPLAPDRRRP